VPAQGLLDRVDCEAHVPTGAGPSPLRQGPRSPGSLAGVRSRLHPRPPRTCLRHQPSLRALERVAGPPIQALK
jgi:hypothetical protein